MSRGKIRESWSQCEAPSMLYDAVRYPSARRSLREVNDTETAVVNSSKRSVRYSDQALNKMKDRGLNFSHHSIKAALMVGKYLFFGCFFPFYIGLFWIPRALFFQLLPKGYFFVKTGLLKSAELIVNYNVLLWNYLKRRVQVPAYQCVGYIGGRLKYLDNVISGTFYAIGKAFYKAGQVVLGVKKWMPRARFSVNWNFKKKFRLGIILPKYQIKGILAYVTKAFDFCETSSRRAMEILSEEMSKRVNSIFFKPLTYGFKSFSIVFFSPYCNSLMRLIKNQTGVFSKYFKCISLFFKKLAIFYERIKAFIWILQLPLFKRAEEIRKKIELGRQFAGGMSLPHKGFPVRDVLISAPGSRSRTFKSFDGLSTKMSHISLLIKKTMPRIKFIHSTGLATNNLSRLKLFSGSKINIIKRYIKHFYKVAWMAFLPVFANLRASGVGVLDATMKQSSQLKDLFIWRSRFMLAWIWLAACEGVTLIQELDKKLDIWALETVKQLQKDCNNSTS